MEQIPPKICIVLIGSFFPLHEGHIDLLSTAKQYYEKHNYEVVKCLICPSHFGSLLKKFPNLSQKNDNRIEIINDVLSNYNWIDSYFDLIKNDTNVGCAVIMKKIIDDFASLKIKVIQLCGTDSMIYFTKKSLNVLVVRDCRPIPEHNKSILKNVPIINMQITKPIISSTILRYINKTQYPQCTISDFSLNWLTSINILLGKGKQGSVYVMLLGRYEVAVKIYILFSQEDKMLFENETSILLNISQSDLHICPNVYYCGIVGQQFNESILGFGIIVTDMCVQLQKIFPVVHKYWEFCELRKSDIAKENENKNQQLIQNFVGTFQSFEMKIEDTRMHAKIQKFIEMKNGNKNNLKLQIINGLNSCLEKLNNMHIVHRDLSYDNIVIDIKNDTVIPLFIDFGIAKKSNSELKIRRGSLRYYPICAIDNFAYDFSCDKYMLSFVIYELINECEIYPECDGDTRKIINNRKKKIYPIWNIDHIYFNEIVEYVTTMWKS